MAAPGALGDPRLEQAGAPDAGVGPIVVVPRGGPSTLMIALGALIAALILFLILDAQRRAATAPVEPLPQTAVPPAQPPLQIPPEALPQEFFGPAWPPPRAAPEPPVPRPAQPQVVYVPQPALPDQVPVPEPPSRVAPGPALVVDTSGAPGPASASGSEAAAAAAAVAPATVTIAGGRVRSGMFANRPTTVPQGTIIPAVLETALDSTRPGFARAIVSRDVRGFDGTRVLIPRGSRLIGEYRSEVAPGQRRALVNWVRLIRPDGVTIAIGSPAGDPLGRGGIRARVNTHFFERFAGAILQSALDIGVTLAAGRVGNGTVVVLPGSFQGTAQVVQPAQITPTLTVRQGTSISIFAARDLDFSPAERRQ